MYASWCLIVFDTYSLWRALKASPVGSSRFGPPSKFPQLRHVLVVLSWTAGCWRSLLTKRGYAQWKELNKPGTSATGSYTSLFGGCKTSPFGVLEGEFPWARVMLQGRI